MLKSTLVHDVTVTLNDGKKMNCLLASKPNALVLAAVAASMNADTELIEAMAFVRDLSVPDAPQADGVVTEIKVAGTLIGSVSIVSRSAFIDTPKRGRKPKSDTPDTPSDKPDAPADTPVDPPANVAADCRPDRSADTPDVTPDVTPDAPTTGRQATRKKK